MPTPWTMLLVGLYWCAHTLMRLCYQTAAQMHGSADGLIIAQRYPIIESISVDAF